jgi:hypothetical protein
MPNKPGIPVPPLDMADEKAHRRQIAAGVANALGGKLNATASVTLTASATATTLTDARIGPTTHLAFSPLTASAATAAAGLYVSAQRKGVATLTHASNAAADQTFRVLMIG